MTAHQSINAILKAISDPTRREIFHLLAMEEASLTLSQISEKFEMTRQGISKHIRQLEEAGLVVTSNEGRERYCTANAKPLQEIQEWVGSYEYLWDPKLAKLEQLFEKNVDTEPMDAISAKVATVKTSKKKKKKGKDKKKKKKKKGKK